MTKIHTHYDNLKVTRDAPPEVVRAAYQALSRKHHPDKNQGDVAAQRVMSLINAAYDVLSDPQKREQHDRWIRSMELEVAPRSQLIVPAPVVEPPPAFGSAIASAPVSSEMPTRPALPNRKDRIWHSYVAAGGLGVGLALCLVAILVPWKGSATNDPAPARTKAAAAPDRIVPVVAETPPVETSSYVRPNRTPTGEPWPVESGYVPGFKELFNDGLSSVTIDNSANPSDVYVKLYALREPRSFTVRWVFVKAGERYVVTQLRSGRYDLRYRDLDSGMITRTEPFDLKEATVAEGTRFTQVKLSLQKANPRQRTATAKNEADF